MTQHTTPVHHAGAESATPFVPYTRLPRAERFLEHYLGEGCPVRLPDAHRHYIVLGMPWAPIVAAPVLVIALVASAIATVFGGPAGMLSAVLTVALVGLAVASVPGLFRKTRSGWALVIYANAIGLAQGVVDLAPLQLLLDLAFFWLLFQVKYRYA